jgi:hypothetical protein
MKNTNLKFLFVETSSPLALAYDIPCRVVLHHNCEEYEMSQRIHDTISQIERESIQP